MQQAQVLTSSYPKPGYKFCYQCRSEIDAKATLCAHCRTKVGAANKNGIATQVLGGWGIMKRFMLILLIAPFALSLFIGICVAVFKGFQQADKEHQWRLEGKNVQVELAKEQAQKDKELDETKAREENRKKTTEPDPKAQKWRLNQVFRFQRKNWIGRWEIAPESNSAFAINTCYLDVRPGFYLLSYEEKELICRTVWLYNYEGQAYPDVHIVTLRDERNHMILGTYNPYRGGLKLGGS